MLEAVWIVMLLINPQGEPAWVAAEPHMPTHMGCVKVAALMEERSEFEILDWRCVREPRR